MNIAHQAREKLRAQVLKRYRVYEALYLVTNNIAVNNRDTFVLSRQTISKANKVTLKSFLHRIEDDIRELRKHYGVSMPDAELIELAARIESAPGESICWIPKTRYGEMFSRPEQILPNFHALPEHTFIGIDPGKYRTKPGSCELFILEAKIFEDLAALFNVASDLTTRLDPVRDGKPAHKTVDAISRAVIAYAVFFFEAYFNGIAADYVFGNEQDLDIETKGLLLDWDFSRDRPRYMSLREKAFKYPRIILKTTHSPVQEGDTPQFSLILETASRIRDLIAHPSLNREVKNLEIFFGIGIDIRNVEEIVDAVVQLVRKFESAIRGNDSRLDWLHSRGANGTFPDSVFD